MHHNIIYSIIQYFQIFLKESSHPSLNIHPSAPFRKAQHKRLKVKRKLAEFTNSVAEAWRKYHGFCLTECLSQLVQSGVLQYWCTIYVYIYILLPVPVHIIKYTPCFCWKFHKSVKVTFERLNLFPYSKPGIPRWNSFDIPTWIFIQSWTWGFNRVFFLQLCDSHFVWKILPLYRCCKSQRNIMNILLHW